MRKSFIFGIVVFGFVFSSLGCQTQPKATPVSTPTEEVIVVVVTATSEPSITPTIGEPSITPLATFTPLGSTVTIESPSKAPTRKSATAAPITPKSSRTNTPVITSAVPTTIPVQNKYSAPSVISPGVGNSVRDGSDIQFFFGSVGPLGTNECYLLDVQMINPNAGAAGVAGDHFLDINHCGDQSAVNKSLKFVLNRPKYASPNYGTIAALAQNAAPTDQLKVQWNVRVVQNNGLQSDGVHYNTVPLSPASLTAEFTFLMQ